jgi:hypothetical protein
VRDLLARRRHRGPAAGSLSLRRSSASNQRKPGPFVCDRPRAVRAPSSCRTRFKLTYSSWEGCTLFRYLQSRGESRRQDVCL